MRLYLLLLAAALLFCSDLYGKENVKLQKTTVPPVIDGILDDLAWKESSVFDEFITYTPDFNQNLPEKTISYVTYDDENLYFAFRCYDSEPEKIVATISNRDEIKAEDWVCLNLDTQNDQQSLIALYINPYGIQLDASYATGKEDVSTDLVWYSAGTIDEEGYNVEIQLPFKSIRFSEKEPVTMGVILERRISRYSMQGTYPALKPERGMDFLNQMMEITMEEVKHYRLFEAIPAFTYSYRDKRTSGEWGEADHKPDPSLTLKYGISSNLVVDATLNPDYSQVESDAGQIDVNLRYDVFYPEKRPFFQEGSERFAVAATNNYEDDPLSLLVNTRTVVNPLAGVKFSGKAGDNNDFTMMYAADEISDQAENRKAINHVPVLRYKRSFKEDTFIGLLYTGGESSESYNRAYGLDGQIRLNKSTLFEFNGFNSHTLQDSHITSGHAAGLYLKSSTRKLQYSLIARDIHQDFNVNTAYLRRKGITQIGGSFQPHFYPESSLFKRIDLGLFALAGRDRIYSMWEHLSYASVMAMMGGTTSIRLKYFNSSEVYLGKKFNTSGFQSVFSTRIGTWFTGSLLHKFNNAIYYSDDPYAGLMHRLTFTSAFQPVRKLNIDLSFLYTHFRNAGSKEEVYTYPIERLKITYQFNKYLFLRGILEYNGYRETLLTDFLLSFTYIPGTVFYLGYGSLHESLDIMGERPFRPEQPYDMERGVFLKLSYLFRN